MVPTKNVSKMNIYHKCSGGNMPGSIRPYPTFLCSLCRPELSGEDFVVGVDMADIDEWIAHFALWSSLYQNHMGGKPGEAVLNAPPDIKEKLKDLKAEDICKWRPDLLKMYLEASQDGRENRRKEAEREENKRIVDEFDRKIQPKMVVAGRGVVFLG
jgi:hypothetical protein